MICRMALVIETSGLIKRFGSTIALDGLDLAVVPGEVHRSFLDADSKGQFFAYEIRDQYPYNRVGA